MSGDVRLEDAAPILITGTFRSGTTLLSRMLDSHSKVAVLYDSVNFLRFSYGRYDPISDSQNTQRLLREISERLKSRWDLDLSVERVLTSISGMSPTYSAIYDAVMRDLLFRDPAIEVWGEKTTLVWTRVPAFFEMFPRGRVALIVRDPRAVLASWKKMTQAPGNDYLDSLANCRGAMEAGLQYKKRFVSRRFCVVTYERLVTDAESTLQEICDTFELEFESKMLDVSGYRDKLGNAWAGNSMFTTRQDRISNDMIARWRDELTDWEVCLAERVTLPSLSEFGYSQCEKQDPFLLDLAITEVLKSPLATDGLLRVLLESRGLERFPTDPFTAGRSKP